MNLEIKEYPTLPYIMEEKTWGSGGMWLLQWDNFRAESQCLRLLTQDHFHSITSSCCRFQSIPSTLPIFHLFPSSAVTMNSFTSLPVLLKVRYLSISKHSAKQSSGWSQQNEILLCIMRVEHASPDLQICCNSKHQQHHSNDSHRNGSNTAYEGGEHRGRKNTKRGYSIRSYSKCRS